MNQKPFINLTILFTKACLVFSSSFIIALEPYLQMSLSQQPPSRTEEPKVKITPPQPPSRTEEPKVKITPPQPPSRTEPEPKNPNNQLNNPNNQLNNPNNQPKNPNNQPKNPNNQLNNPNNQLNNPNNQLNNPNNQLNNPNNQLNNPNNQLNNPNNQLNNPNNQLNNPNNQLNNPNNQPNNTNNQPNNTNNQPNNINNQPNNIYNQPELINPKLPTPQNQTILTPNYIGVGGNFGLSGDSTLGENAFTVFSKIGLTNKLSFRPSLMVSNKAVLLIPITIDFPIESFINFAESQVIAVPYIGGGAVVSTDDNSSAGFLLTGGVDVRLSPEFTANAGLDVGFLNKTDVGLRLGVGYNF